MTNHTNRALLEYNHLRHCLTGWRESCTIYTVTTPPQDKIMRFSLSVLGFLLALSTGAMADEKVITVGIKNSKPFVDTVAVEENGVTGKGIAIELWELMAKQHEIKYRYKTYQTIDDLVKATNAGEVDVAVAPISVTSEREDKVDFTHSYFQSGLAALTLSDDVSFLQVFLQQGPGLLGAILLGLLIMFLMGLPFMALEKSKNDGVEDDEKGKAWFDSQYWVSTTLTTVGYGDIVPKTFAGRIYAMFVMWFGLFFTGVFIAFTTNILDTGNVEQITTIHDVKRPVGVLVGSYSEEYALKNGIKVVRYSDGFEAISELRKKRIGAFVHDKPILEYMARNEEGLKVSLVTFTSDNYGFALTPNSGHREEINRAMLEVVESSDWTKIVTSYR